MRLLISLLLPLSMLFAAATPALAADAAKPAAKTERCRDDKGKFIACAKKPATPVRCRDDKGKFIACKK